MSGLVEILVGPISNLLDKFIPDADTKAKLAFDLSTMAETHHQALMLAQIEVLKLDANSGKWWQAGWRPFFGWVCGMAFFNNFVVLPIASAFGIEITAMDWATMGPVVMGMLGLGGARTFERIKGKA